MYHDGAHAERKGDLNFNPDKLFRILYSYCFYQWFVKGNFKKNIV